MFKEENIKKLELKENERLDDLNIDGLKIIQNTLYFCFGIDSVLLANFVRSNKSSNTLIDFCTGSAVIPILLTSKIKCKKIYGIELQNPMYELAIKNVKLNNLEEKINIIKEDIKNVKEIKKILENENLYDNVDIITVNPPYKKVKTGSVNDTDIKTIARHEIMCNLDDVFLSASKLLQTGGKLYMVHKPDRLTDIICMGRKYKIEVKRIRFMQPYLNASPSVVLIEMVKDASPYVVIEPNIIEYGSDGKYTEEIYKMYEKEENK